MGPARFQETLRRLAIFDERFVPAGLAGDPVGPSVLDARTVALLQVAVSVAMGSSAVCLQWSTAGCWSPASGPEICGSLS